MKFLPLFLYVILWIVLPSVDAKDKLMVEALSKMNTLSTKLSTIATELKATKGTVDAKFDNFEMKLKTLEDKSNDQSAVRNLELQSLKDTMTSDLQSLQGSLNTTFSDVSSNIENLGCPAGLFQVSGSDQCFKFFGDSQNWDSANATCEAEGLVLAKPYDPKALQSYLVMRYAPMMPTWLGALGSQTSVSKTVKWVRDGTTLGTDNPMWATGHPGGLLSNTGLYIGAYENGVNKNPYYMTTKQATFFVLCELLKE